MVTFFDSPFSYANVIKTKSHGRGVALVVADKKHFFYKGGGSFVTYLFVETGYL